MNTHFAYKITKYDIKRICLKHKMELKPIRISGKLKKGYLLYKELVEKIEINQHFI
jgi:hypothetical protein